MMTVEEYKKSRKDYWANVRAFYLGSIWFTLLGVVFGAVFLPLGLIALLGVWLFIEATVSLVKGIFALFLPATPVLRNPKPEVPVAPKPELFTFPEEWVSSSSQPGH